MKLHPSIKTLIDSIAVDTLRPMAITNHPSPNSSVDSWEKLMLLSSNAISPDKLKEFAKNDTSPIPTTRENYCHNDDYAFWISGLLDFQLCTKIASKYEVEIHRYLDFGCASGRVIRHFAHQSTLNNIWGCDINEQYIKWITENLPTTVKPIHTTAIPYIPIEDNYFDLVTAFSVFTHVAVFESTLLCELRRVMKPGSIAILTLQMENSFDWWKKQCSAPNLKNEYCKWILKDNPEFVLSKLDGRSVCIGSEMTPYNSFVHHSTDYVHQTFGRYFKILEIIPFFHGKTGINNQSAVILKK